MKLIRFTQVTLKQILEEMDLKDFKVHTNDEGDIQSVELKYTPRDSKAPEKPMRKDSLNPWD